MLKPILIGFVIGFSALVLFHWTYADPTAFSESAAIATDTEAVDLGIDGRPDSYVPETFLSGIRSGFSPLLAFRGWHAAATGLIAAIDRPQSRTVMIALVSART